MGVEMAEQRAGGALSQAAEPSQSDVYAWQQWAAQQDPGLYGWQGRREFDPLTANRFMQSSPGYIEALLQKIPAAQRDEARRYIETMQAQREYDSSAANSENGQALAPTPTPWEGAAPDLFAMQGYSTEDARGPGHYRMNRLIGPDGQPVAGSENAFYAPGSSLRHGDYADIASVLAIAAAPYMSAYLGAGNAALGVSSGLGYSAAGAGAITGATVGGTVGGLRAGNVEGGIKGAALGAVGGYASGALSGSGTDPLAYGDASQYAGGVYGGGADGLTTQLGGAPQFDAMQFDPNGDYNVMNAGADVPPAPYGSGDPYNPDPAGFGSGPVSDAPDPMADYLRTGATDMSTPTGQGGYAGAIDAASGGTEMLGTYEHALYGPPGGPGSTPPGGGDQVEITTTRLPAQPPAGPGLGTAAAGAGALSTVANAGDAPISGDGGGDPYNDPSGPNYKPVEVDPSFQSPDYLDLLTRGASSLFNNSSLMNDLMSLIGHGVNQASIERAAQEQRNWLDKQASDKRRRQMPGALARARISVIPGSASRMTTPTTPDRARAG